MLALVLLAPPCATLPHIVFVLVDDLGHANVGFNRRRDSIGGESAAQQALVETNTPRIDALAASGIILRHHYTYSFCSPSRSSLMSGRLGVHVNMHNADPALRNPLDPVSGFAGIPRNMTGIGTKLAQAGYATHMVGKWDAGLATPEHTPLGRGFHSWFGFFGHANDYWTYDNTLKATGHIDNCLNLFGTGKDFFYANSTYRGRAAVPAGCEAPAGVASCYEDALFANEVVRLIEAHPVDVPLFVLYSPGLLHTPLQVPATHLERIDALVKARGGAPFDSANRRTYAAMALFLDDAVGAISDALTAKRMWETTLLVFASDNGGPTYEPGAANNHPLRGGKFSDFEGGVNAVAFVAGGFVPHRARGTSSWSVVSIADWYSTFCELAGVDPMDDAAAQANRKLSRQGLPLLPPIDSVPQWRFITDGGNGRPSALHLSPASLVRWPYKLVTGVQFSGDHWQGDVYPNCTGFQAGRTPTAISFFRAMGGAMEFFASAEEERRLSFSADCTSGCLFDLSTDPYEHRNLATEHGGLLSELVTELARLNGTIFDPDRGSMETTHCTVALEHGAYGPFVDVDGWYTPSPVVEGWGRRASHAAMRWAFSRVDHAMARCIAMYQFILPLAGPAISKGFDACIGDGHAGDPRLDPTRDSSIVFAGVVVDRFLYMIGLVTAVAWQALVLAIVAAACACSRRCRASRSRDERTNARSGPPADHSAELKKGQ